MEGYSVQISESSKELTAKQRIKMKDLGDAKSIDEMTKEGGLIIDVESYVTLEVHNEKSENKDYEVYVLIDKNGDKYKTGSASFWDSFINIWNEMESEEEPWSLNCYRLPSKKYNGKDFLTCTVE